jgi:hypothetical protein
MTRASRLHLGTVGPYRIAIAVGEYLEILREEEAQGEGEEEENRTHAEYGAAELRSRAMWTDW